jgi:hypothetical protein
MYGGVQFKLFDMVYHTVVSLTCQHGSLSKRILISFSKVHKFARLLSKVISIQLSNPGPSWLSQSNH